MVHKFKKPSRREKKYVKDLITYDKPKAKIKLLNKRTDEEMKGNYYKYDVVNNGRVIGDVIFNKNGKLETGYWNKRLLQ